MFYQVFYQAISSPALVAPVHYKINKYDFQHAIIVFVVTLSAIIFFILMLCKTQSQMLKNKISEMQEIQISKSVALVLCNQRI